jgi:hypothetical protein
MSQPTSDTPSSPRQRLLLVHVGIFLGSTGVLWLLLWWNQHGIAVVSRIVSLTFTWVYQTGVTSPGALTGAGSILGGLAISLVTYLANRPRRAATAPPHPAARIDPNSPIEMPLPPAASPPPTVILAVFLGATAAVMVLLPLVEAVLLLGAFEFRTRDELIGDGFTAYGLISAAVRFFLSIGLGAAAAAGVEKAYRRAALNQPHNAP